MSAAFCTWGGFDSPETVIEEWRDSLNNSVSESLDSICFVVIMFCTTEKD